ncbi:hypothetical protein Z043_112324 [Scleropages formosus]|uniref:Zinc finger and BTB domain-containing protein 11-like n=1 Tax=Scleropages formosus TaxID=113540 RepID=A0A0P7UGL9_SCLFO|nr:hypothetical protein Z043_112324 [Scleropages formosus]
MAGNSACNAKCVGDEILDAKREREGEPDTKESASKEVPSSPYFEVIDGVLYRKKLEKGFINYREVLDKERRQNAIATFHHKRPGSRHHTLEDTYRYVAENYWWEGMYFHIREYVMNCQECQMQPEGHEIRSKSLVSKTLESHSNDLLGKLKGQWEEGLFCDITLKTGGRSFCAHKAVLAAVSEYFQEIFAEMASSPTPQSDIDLTGFSAESFLPLLEFSYTSTLSLKLEDLTEVSTMARHFRMWAVVEACRAIQREQGAGTGKICLKSEPCAGGYSFESSSPRLLEDSSSQHDGPAVISTERITGMRKRKSAEKEEDPAGNLGSLGNCRESVLDQSFKLTLEPSDESGVETPSKLVKFTHQSPKHGQQDGNGLPCSPTRRLKLMDFKSPSSKGKASHQSLSISHPPVRILRSTPTVSQQQLEPTVEHIRDVPSAVPSSSSRKRKPRIGFPQASQEGTPVKEEPLEEEVHSPRTLEKYRLLSVLGLQRKCLLPGPEELTGWRQKKRLRKLKVDSYSLTARRKPRVQGKASSSGVSGPSITDSSERNVTFLDRVIKTEPPEPISLEDMSRKNTACPLLVAGEHSHRSNTFQEERGLRRSMRGRSSPPLVRPNLRAGNAERASRVPKEKPVRIKAEPSSFPIQPLAAATRSRVSARLCHHGDPLFSLKLKRSAAKGCSLNELSTRVTRRTVQVARCGGGRPAARTEMERNCVRVAKKKKKKKKKKDIKVRAAGHRGAPAKAARVMEGVRKHGGCRQSSPGTGTGTSTRTHRHGHHLLGVIKDEPVDPIPLSVDAIPELGKRQSKPPMKLLDPGFLFSFCRPISSIKKEEEERVDICLTRSMAHSMTPRPSTRKQSGRSAADISSRTRSAIREAHASRIRIRSPGRMEPGAGTSRTRTRLASTERELLNGFRRLGLPGTARPKVKREQPKKNLRLPPLQGRHLLLLGSVRRTRVKQLRQARGRSPVTSHTCFQCRVTYRNCEALIMHRIRHIEGKHWPCPLCSKTFFRQRNVQSHIRTHDHKLYKCPRCLSAS